jgi:Cu/Ag efflux protein CusF
MAPKGLEPVKNPCVWKIGDTMGDFLVMKTSTLRNWTTVSLAVLTTAAFTAVAGEAARMQPQTTSAKTYTGMVKSVDAQNRSVTVTKFIGSKRFNLGDSCVFDLVDKSASSINGVRAGQKVTLTYENANGVLVADHLIQEPLLHKGTVKSIDAEKHTLTVGSKTYQIADDCPVVLRDNKAGTTTDVKPGLLVTVLHEDSDGLATARQITQTSETFRGSLTAIDLSDRTIKAKATFGSKQFQVANNCTILLGGKPAEMGSLKPGDKLEFSYDEVDGINVVTRIVPSDEPVEATTAQIK